MRTLTSPRVVLATHNVKKSLELAKLLNDFNVKVVTSASLEVPPPRELTLTEGGTFIGNATLKAEETCKATDEWCLADDGGLCVDFLNGLPSVDTAYYGGWERVLRELEGVEEDRRGARFECVLALARPGKKTLTFHGMCFGSIITAGRGEGGFGYDPIFRPEGSLKTFAEMSEEEKGRFSHRGKALEKLRTWWRAHD